MGLIQLMAEDSKDDDSVDIDFGRIKNFFKKKESPKEHHHHSQESKPETSQASDLKSELKEEKKEHGNAKEDDGEISIDFGKIKKFFKSDEKEEKSSSVKYELKEEKKEHHHQHQKDDDEVSIDFGKIKNFFKSSGKEKEASDDEISVDWGKAFNFFKKYGIIFIALIPIILSVYVRMQAGSLPLTDQWATNTVLGNLQSQIRAGIDQQYPNLPDANKNALVDSEMQKILKAGTLQVQGQTVSINDYIKGTSNYFKQFFQDENGKNYMPDIDPYYWLRYANNIVDHGHPGDELRDGKPFDNHQLAPNGRFVTPDMFHSYFIAYFHKAVHIFIPSISLARSIMYVPVFLSAIAVLLVFLIARKIAGNTAGFFAAMIMAVNSAFLGRTLFGHVDTDPWVVVFPLIVTWLFVEAIGSKKIWKIVSLMVAAGFVTGIFTYAWTGWWYIFYFLLATLAGTFVYLVAINYKSIKNPKFFISHEGIRDTIMIGVVYFISSGVFITIFSGFREFSKSFRATLLFPAIKAPVFVNLWPNVLTTVAELNEGSINSVINSIGSSLFFFICLLGIVLSLYKGVGIKRKDWLYIAGSSVFYGIIFMNFGSGAAIYQSVSTITFLILITLPIWVKIVMSIYKKEESYDFEMAILLALWVASTIFASLKGIRFTLLLAPAFSVAFGVAIGMGYNYILKFLTGGLKVQKYVAGSILIILLLLVYINPIRGAIAAAGSDLPLVNDAWYSALTKIRQDSKPNAIITSWWDFGHHFKQIADRPVTFDGTTQTSPAAHWVGELLMVDSEEKAAGILRMLDCGGNKAYDKIYKANDDVHKSIKLVEELVSLNRAKAEKKLLDSGFDKKDAEEILTYTHCSPPEAYFIASEDMVGKSGVWAHFGAWSFERADLWYNVRKMPQDTAVEYMQSKFNYTKERAENTYFEMQAISSDSEANAWVSPWPSYGGSISCSRKDKETFECDNGLKINMTTKDVFGNSQSGIVRPKVVAFTNDEGLEIKKIESGNLDFGVTFIPKSPDEFEGIISHPDLTGSIFTQMFYMQGHGLKYFKPFDHERGLTGTDIYVYKLDWDAKNTTIIESYLTKPKLNNS
ncbi:MAG TPA: STT3 domain-containing protein [Candidatus Nanoarchaeia archaeon]|nr:STT3 domain-containing protein [Candidatus Nanoarchaeia archaeon]